MSTAECNYLLEHMAVAGPSAILKGSTVCPLPIVLVAVFIDSGLNYFHSTMSLSDPDLERLRERSHLGHSPPRYEYWPYHSQLCNLGQGPYLSLLGAIYWSRGFWNRDLNLHRAGLRQNVENAFHNIWYRISTQVTYTIIIYNGYYLWSHKVHTHDHMLFCCPEPASCLVLMSFGI